MIDEMADKLSDLAMTVKSAMETSPGMGTTVETLRPDDDMTKGGVKYDEGKLRYELIPPEGPHAVATVLGYGARKYAARNWEQGMEWSRPYAAIQRHLQAWWGGEDRDPDTGYSHLWHVATNAFFLIAYTSRQTGTDDRPRPQDIRGLET